MASFAAGPDRAQLTGGLISHDPEIVLQGFDEHRDGRRSDVAHGLDGVPAHLPVLVLHGYQ
jgi:hypothetical protein